MRTTTSTPFQCGGAGRLIPLLHSLLASLALVVATGAYAARPQLPIVSQWVDPPVVVVDPYRLPEGVHAASVPAIKSQQSADAAGSYAFFAGTAPLYDMSFLTTEMIPGFQDNGLSALTDIGFDFFFQGAAYQQFSVNSDGLLRLGGIQAHQGVPFQPLGQASQALITPFGSNQRMHTGDGTVRYKVDGVAPDRVLTVEWRNMQSYFVDGGTADLTYQVRLYETSGAIVFVYGSMTMSATGAADDGSKKVHIGFSSGNTAGTIASVAVAQSGTPGPVVDATSATATVNTYVAGAIPGLSGRFFRFTPPIPTAPTSLSFTGVTQTATTLNWTNSPDETAYAIYRSSDNVNFVLHGVAPQNATSYAATGLTPGTNHSWRVYAVSEGALSASALTGQQSTAAATVRMSTASGNWSAPATWAPNPVPVSTDDVAIESGHTVTIDTSPTVNRVTVKTGGVLRFEQFNSQTLTTMLDLTVNSGGTLATQAVGVGDHRVRIHRDLFNYGTINFAAGVSRADIVFNGPFNSLMLLNGATNLATGGGVIVAKTVGASRPAVLFVPNSEPSVAGAFGPGFLVITSGTFRWTGDAFGEFLTDLFSAAAWMIPAAGGLWLDSVDAFINPQSGTATVAGLLRVDNGNLIVGLAANDSLVLAPGAQLIVSGGSVDIAGRLGVASASDPIQVTHSGGTMFVCTFGNSSASSASLDYGIHIMSNVVQSGGRTVLRRGNSNAMGPGDYRTPVTTAVSSVTGGSVEFGSGLTDDGTTFRASGVMPDVVISNASAGNAVRLLSQGVTPNRVNNVKIDPGTTLILGSTTLAVNGTTLTNNGTLDAVLAEIRWMRGGSAQTYTGAGTTTGPIRVMTVENNGSLTIDPASPIGVLRFALISGSVINTGKITLGDGFIASVQIGNDTTPTAADSFDAPFTFNAGSNVQTLLYLRTTTPRTTGPEVVPSRMLNILAYNNDNPAHSLTIAGGGLTVSNDVVPLNLVNGRIVMGAGDALTVAPGAGAVSRTNGWVDGTLKKTFAAAGSKTFEVGTANGYSPVTVNATAGTFPAAFTARAFEGVYPNFNGSPFALKRHWYLSPAAITADLTFNWRDPTDLPTAAPESALVLYNQNGAITTPGGTVNAAANSATITGVTSFAAWTLAAPVDMIINKSHVGSAFTKGQNGAQYLLKVTNGPAVVPDGTVITVKDTLPAALTFVSASGPGWTCGAVGQDVTCTITQAGGAPLSASAVSVITLTVNVAANAPATIQNTATCNCSVISPEKNSFTDTVTVNPVLGSGVALTVSKSGSGTGKVLDAADTINCGTFCSQNYPAGTMVTLTAMPDAGSRFTGWAGACTGTGSCVITTTNSPKTVSATFAPVSIGNRILDVDLNNQYEALNDGLLILRYLFNIPDDLLIKDVIGAQPNRSTVLAIKTYLADVLPLLDVDGNGKSDALSDGLMIIRYLFSLRDDNLIRDAIGNNATRTTSDAVKLYLDTLKP